MPKLSEDAIEENIRIVVFVATSAALMGAAYTVGPAISFVGSAAAVGAAFIAYPDKMKLWAGKLSNWVESHGLEFLGAGFGLALAGPLGLIVGAGVGHWLHRISERVADSKVVGLLGGAVGLLGAVAAVRPVESIKQITAAVADKAADLYSAAQEMLDSELSVYDTTHEVIELPLATPADDSDSESDLEEQPGLLSYMFRLKGLRCFAPRYYDSDEDDYAPRSSRPK